VTTHLFWHPLYLAERTRQVAVLLRETLRFRQQGGWEAWPIVMAGGTSLDGWLPPHRPL
jgi:RNA exonuclease NGL2